MPSELYVLDTNVISALRSYYPSPFRSLWKQLDKLLDDGRLVSVREVARELDRLEHPEWLTKWTKRQRGFFAAPTAAETRFVAEIFAVPHFRSMVERKAQLRGEPVADPFVIAAARARGGCVVTQERAKPHSAKIPNVCKHFGVPCLDLEGLMAEQGWSYLAGQ